MRGMLHSNVIMTSAFLKLWRFYGKSLACHERASLNAPMKTTMKTLLTLALSSLVLISCSQDGSSEQKKKSSQPVVVLKAYALPLTTEIKALGTAQANEAIVITSKISGTLKSISFEDGQMVKKGAVVARFDQDEEQALLATAKIQLLEHEREIKRLTTLIEKHAASARDLDERKTLAAVARSTVKQIQARLDELTIRVPFSGKLGIRQVSAGALVQPGTVITTLDQTDTMKLDFTIPATQLEGVKVGTRLQATSDSLKHKVFEGTVAAINSRLDPMTRTLMLRAHLDNKEHTLIPGMLMNIKMHVFERQAIVVPEESITQKKMQHFITVIRADNTAELRTITMGERYYGYVEIVDGLTPGELVVVRGMEFARTGSSVSISETWTEIQGAQFPAALSPATEQE